MDLCLSAAGHTPRWPAARREFAAAIAAYGPNLPELRDDAAEAHAGLGLYYFTVERAPAAYKDARREYIAAADLTTIRRRGAYFDGAVGFADARLRDYSAAMIWYEKGADMAPGTRLARSLTRSAARLPLKARTGR